MKGLIALSFVLSVAGTVAVLGATNAAIERLEVEILAEHRNASPAKMIGILGVPTRTSERDGREFLTWEIAKQSGYAVYGIGAVESYSCSATLEFNDQRLVRISLVGAHGADRTLCKEFGERLLPDEPYSNGGNLAAKRAAANSIAGRSSTSSPSEVLTNADIVKLVGAKLSDAVIIAKIRSSKCKFDTTTDSLIFLKQAGVSDAIIQVMTESSSAAPR